MTPRTVLAAVAIVLHVVSLSSAQADSGPSRVTILYDVFGRSTDLHKDWGFAAFLEIDGKRILFDTGNHPETFAHNVGAARVDLTKLDFVVISHRHLDHTAGLTWLLQVNPDVTIYAPAELAGTFGSTIPQAFYRKDPSLPDDSRYYGGEPPERIALGTAWPGARFQTISETTEIRPGMHLIALVSDGKGTREMRELSLAIETRDGLHLVVGCSHPGIERIARAATAIDPRIRTILGGLHLPSTPDEEISRIADRFHDDLKVRFLAPGHCTGEPALGIFSRKWGDRFIFAGLGEVIDLR